MAATHHISDRGDLVLESLGALRLAVRSEVGLLSSSPSAPSSAKSCSGA